MDEILEEILAFLTREIGARVDEADALLSAGQLDSVGLVRLAALIEKRTGLTIPDEDLVVENFDTLGRMRSYLAPRLAKNS